MQIRAFRPEDTQGILAIYGPIVSQSTATFEIDVPEFHTFEQRLARIAGRFPFLVAEDDQGTIVGYTYATTHRERIAYQWAVETSVYVAQPGQGLGRTLYQALLPELTERGFLWAYGVITLPNEASIGLHDACGFSPFALYSHAGQKFGAWWDVQWMRKALNSARPGMPSPQFGPAQALRLPSNQP